MRTVGLTVEMKLRFQISPVWTGTEQSDHRTNVYEKEAIVREDLEIGKTHQCPDPDDPKKMKVR